MYTNDTQIPLSMAVWLATDTYDHVVDPLYYSATTILRPIREQAIVKGLGGKQSDLDITSNIASNTGRAIHDSIELAWKYNYPKAMADLGYPQHIIDKIILNPKDSELADDKIPLYMEQRFLKKIGIFTIGGKLDFLLAGTLEDFKTTKTYTWIMQTNTQHYKEQGSIYRWLIPDKITNPIMEIQYLFTDWSPLQARIKPKEYPPSKILTQKLNLIPEKDIEDFILKRVTQVHELVGRPQSEMPLCTKEELWQDDTKWKYYKNPLKKARATKNFDNAADAYARLAQEGVGEVMVFKGTVKKCNFCSAQNFCQQAEEIKAAGILQDA